MACWLKVWRRCCFLCKIQGTETVYRLVCVCACMRAYVFHDHVCVCDRGIYSHEHSDYTKLNWRKATNKHLLDTSSQDEPKALAMSSAFEQTQCAQVVCDWMSVALHSVHFNLHLSGVLPLVFGCYIIHTWCHVKLLMSRHTLCTLCVNLQCHFIQSCIDQ